MVLTHPSQRLVGLDVARCLALLGMVAARVLDARRLDGRLAWHVWLVEGRASALFAVLAGVSLALMARRTNTMASACPRSWWRCSDWAWVSSTPAWPSSSPTTACCSCSG